MGATGSPDVAEATRDEAPLVARLLLAVAACGSVIPLLAWGYDLGKFSTWGWAAAYPLVVLLVGATVWMERTGRYPLTRAAVTAGALGGALGTVAYDLLRVPFVVLEGRQLLAPIDSYGVLLLDAAYSSGLTGFAGWGYHAINGIGFGIAYAVVMRGRHWGWGVLWGLTLETAVVISPFATDYALRTEDGFKWVPIIIAYIAHVPYGFAVGRFAQHAGARHATARRVTPRPVLLLSAAVALALLVWQWPLFGDDRIAEGRAAAPGASAAVDERGVWHPTWLRVAPGECATIVIAPDSGLVQLRVGPPGAAITAQEPLDRQTPAEVCPGSPGISRWQVDGQPFSGGWIITDDALEATP